MVARVGEVERHPAPVVCVERGGDHGIQGVCVLKSADRPSP